MADFKILNGYDVKDNEARSDIAELETTISSNNTYSTDETLTGEKWIDNKPIYRKVINFGAFPSGSGKQTAHGITNLDKIVSIRCIGIRDSSSNSKKFYEINPYYLAYGTDMSTLTFFEVYADKTYVNVDRNPHDSEIAIYIDASYIILEYTKTE